MNDTSTPSWKPRHRFGKLGKGEIYCSPACGSDCTRAAYDNAVRSSAALAKQLGPQWKPRVWENSGWHWSVQAGPVSIHYSTIGPSHYSCLIASSPDLPGTGGGAWTPQDTNGKTPQIALRKALKGMRAYRERINQAADAAEAVVEKGL